MHLTFRNADFCFLNGGDLFQVSYKPGTGSPYNFTLYRNGQQVLSGTEAKPPTQENAQNLVAEFLEKTSPNYQPPGKTNV